MTEGSPEVTIKPIRMHFSLITGAMMAQDIGVTCLLGGDLCCYQCAPLLSPTGYKAKKRLLTSLLGPILPYKYVLLPWY